MHSDPLFTNFLERLPEAGYRYGTARPTEPIYYEFQKKFPGKTRIQTQSPRAEDALAAGLLPRSPTATTQPIFRVLQRDLFSGTGS